MGRCRWLLAALLQSMLLAQIANAQDANRGWTRDQKSEPSPPSRETGDQFNKPPDEPSPDGETRNQFNKPPDEPSPDGETRNQFNKPSDRSDSSAPSPDGNTGGRFIIKKERPTRTNERACDLSKMRKVPQEIQATLKGFMANTASTRDLMSVMGYVPSACIRQLEQSFSDKQCSADDALTGFCEACGEDSDCPKMRLQEIGKSILSCLEKEDACEVLAELMDANSTCLPLEATGALSKAAINLKCSTDSLPACSLLELPTDELEDHLDSLPDQKITHFIQSLDEDFSKTMPCDKTRHIARLAIAHRLYNFSAIPEDPQQFKRLLEILPYVDAKVCAKIPLAWLEPLLRSLLETDFKCNANRGKSSSKRRETKVKVQKKLGMEKASPCAPSHDGEYSAQSANCEARCGSVIAEKMLEGGMLNVASKQGRESLGSLAKCLPAKNLLAAAQPGQCSDFGPDFVPANEKARRLLAKKCRPTKDAAAWSAADVQSMACSFTELGASDRKRIPSQAICDSLDSLSDCLKEEEGHSQEFDRLVARKCSAGQRMSVEKVRTLGKAAVQAPCDALKNMTAGDLAEVAGEMLEGLAQMVSKGQRGSRGKAACVKLSDLPLDQVASSKEVARNLPLKKLKSRGGADKDSFRKAMGLDKGVVPDLPKHQNKLGFDIMKGEKDITDLSKEEVRNMSSLVQGIASRDIRKFNQTDRLEILQDLCSFGDWGTKQSAELGSALEDAFRDFNPDYPMEEVTTSFVEDISDNCLVGLGERLINTTQEVCVSICTRLGQTDRLQCVMSPPRRRRIANICLQCLDAYDRDLTQEDVEMLGVLLPDIPVEALDRTPAAVLKDNGYRFSDLRCLRKDIIDAIQTKINTAIRLNETEDELLNLGVWATGISPADAEQLKAGLSEVAATVTEYFGEGPVDTCCRKMMADDATNIEEVTTDIGGRMEQMTQIILDTAEPENARRRRRETEALTCSTLLSLGPAMTELTTEQLSSLVQAEFVDCLQTLGEQEGWTADQLVALVDNFKQHVAADPADVCPLSSEDLQSMGSIAYGLTAAELGCLTGLDTDATSNLGDLTGWSSEQKSAVVTQFMTNQQINDAASLTSDNLMTLGHFVCGLSADQIGQVPAAAYGEASATIGGLETCEHDRLVALATLAKHADNHGDVSGWTAAEYGDVGIVAAGLSAEELKMATVDDIEGWTENAVGAMRDVDLKELSVEQLSSLSMAQAFLLDVSSMEYSSEQVDAILEARGTLFSDSVTVAPGDGSSGNSTDSGTEDGNTGGENTSGAQKTKFDLLGTLIFITMSFLLVKA